ncbi:MAG: JmjC domain-containing protein [Pseudomonadales bacterium]
MPRSKRRKFSSVVLLRDITEGEFLADYWQQKPLLIRNALPAFFDPITGDELAGLAMEEDVESRLISMDAQANTSQLRHGPFTVDELQALDDNNWTLLVQAVDQWVEEVAELRHQCSFLPQWRLDDVMVSYAMPGGGVGPHFDQYDVFLLQGKGSRLWRIGPACNDKTPQINNFGLKSIEPFTPLEEYTLCSGDVLYLPPSVAHWGIAQSESLTYSIGFRAPSHAEVLSEWSHSVAAMLNDQLRYTDPLLEPANRGSLIDSDIVDSLQHILQHYANDRDALTQWFGTWVTEPKYPELAQEAEVFSEQDLQASMREHTHLQRLLPTRVALSKLRSGWVLFVNGDAIPLVEASVKLAQRIVEDPLIMLEDLAPSCKNTNNRQLLSKLLANGGFALVDA